MKVIVCKILESNNRVLVMKGSMNSFKLIEFWRFTHYLQLQYDFTLLQIAVNTAEFLFVSFKNKWV